MMSGRGYAADQAISRYKGVAGSTPVDPANLYANPANPLAKDFGLRDQIQRAAVSVMTNIAEGFDCDSNAEFARFLGIARRSAVEVQSLLYTNLDIGYISKAEFEALFNQAEKTKALIGGLKHSLKKKASSP